MAEAPEFVHLHVHSEFTMLDGAVELTARDNMNGADQLNEQCRG